MRFLNLSWRNIQRNGRRTLLTLSAIAISNAALICGWALLDGQSAQMMQNMTGYYTGHVQIHRQGYDANPSLDLSFHPGKTVAALKQIGAVSSTSRLSNFALLSSDANTRGVQIVGIDPETEPKVTVLHTKIAAGRYFSIGDHGGVILGRPLAKSMGVTVGSEVAVIVEGVQASMGAQRFRVQGIFDTGSESIDSRQIFVTLNDAFSLLNSDSLVTTIALRFSSLESVDSALSTLRSALGGDFEVLGWRELLPEVAQHIDFHGSMVGMVMMLLFIIVTAGVANTLLMSIVERQREFGVMMALGTSPWQIFRGIVYEGLLIGLIGFAIGLAVGGGFSMLLGATGIDVGQDIRAYPLFQWKRVGLAGFGMLLVVLGATVYPAWRAARLLPIAALRQFGGPGGRRLFRWNGPLASSHFLTSMLAIRNLFRYPLRSGLTLMAISLGLTTFVFFGAFAQGYLSQIVENATNLVTGDVQIQHPSFRAEMKPEFAFASPPRLLDTLRELPQVEAVSPRIQISAIANSAMRSEPITLIGVNPEQERRVTILHRAIGTGSELQRDRDIVIGQKLAERLNKRIGEKLVTVLQDAKGDLVYEAFSITGIFDTGSTEMDRNVAYVMLPKLQSMVGLSGKVTSLAIRLKNRAETPQALYALDTLIPADNLRALRWQELLPQVEEMKGLVNGGLALITAIVLAVVALVIMNTILMSVFERKREFGTLLALGASPLVVVRIVALESAILASAGTALGALLGAGIAWHYSRAGITLQILDSGAVPAMANTIHPALSFHLLLQAGLAVFVVVLLASIYPAIKISRLNPVKAIRQT